MPPAGGVLVSFRDNVTDAILWTAAMNVLPVKNDKVWYAEVDGVLAEYKVKGVRWEFWKPKPIGEGPTTNCQHSPIVTVDLV